MKDLFKYKVGLHYCQGLFKYKKAITMPTAMRSNNQDELELDKTNIEFGKYYTMTFDFKNTTKMLN